MSSSPLIVVAGGTGFLGAPLTRALAVSGVDVVLLTRRPGAHAETAVRAVAWTPDGTAGPWASALDGAAAVINLAGEPIATRRWSAARKARIRHSRVQATRSLAEAIARARTPPPVFVSASGVGYYGAHDDDVVTEETPAGDDFLAEVCQVWEAEAHRAASPLTRVACIRTGLVVDHGGGALAQMLLPFKFGLGGPVGSGRQYWSWIHRDDWVRLVLWMLNTPTASGAVNATAPNPVTNREFTRALGRALHRPAVLPAPAIGLRIAFGEMADALLLSGQRVIPAKALHGGFQFTYPRVEDAFGAIFRC
jgi:uncharacterized protein (TIGR01777 family)